MTKQWVNTGIIKWALREKQVRLLQYFLIGREYGKTHAGWVDMNTEFIGHISNCLNVSERTVRKNFKSLVRIGWAIEDKKRGKMYFLSLGRINYLLGTFNSSSVEVDRDNNLLRPYMDFQAFLSAAYKHGEVKARFLRRKHKSFVSGRTGNKERVGMSFSNVSDKTRSSNANTGCWAISLAASDLNRSKSTIHRLKVREMRNRYAFYTRTWRQDFYHENLRTWAEVLVFASFLQKAGHAIELSMFSYFPKEGRFLLRDCDIIRFNLRNKRRKPTRDKRFKSVDISINTNLTVDNKRVLSYKEYNAFTETPSIVFGLSNK